jgi:hypothetical protein
VRQILIFCLGVASDNPAHGFSCKSNRRLVQNNRIPTIHLFSPQFDSKEFKDYCLSQFITPLNSSPLYAQSNGLSEAAVKAAKYLLIKSNNFADFEACLDELQAVPSAGNTISPAELFYKRSFRTKLPTISDFYDPLEAATSDNKFRVGEKVRWQNDKKQKVGRYWHHIGNSRLGPVVFRRERYQWRLGR